MGTNYYAILGKKTVTCDCGYEHLVDDRIHIGKNSYGWAFHLQGYNDEDHQIKSLVDWQNVLKKAVKIKDEYGEEVSYDEMMKIILKPTQRKTKKELKCLEDECEKLSKYGSNVIVRNGLLAETEYLQLASPKDDENYVIDFHEFC